MCALCTFCVMCPCFLLNPTPVSMCAKVPTRLKPGAIAGSGGPLASLKFLKQVASRPPTMLAEFRGRTASPTYPVAVARALRGSFGLHGVPVRVLPISKERRAEPARRGQLGRHGSARKRPRVPPVAQPRMAAAAAAV